MEEVRRREMWGVCMSKLSEVTSEITGTGDYGDHGF
jgi:hypothetical protein